MIVVPIRQGATCSTCRYADPAVLDNVDGEGPDVVLLCRRRPPAMITDADAVAPIWPLVSAGDWCGDHTPPPATRPTIVGSLIGWLHARTAPDTDGTP